MLSRQMISTRELALRLQQYASLLEGEGMRLQGLKEFSLDSDGDDNMRIRLIEQEVARVREWALILHYMKTNI